MDTSSNWANRAFFATAQEPDEGFLVTDKNALSKEGQNEQTS